MMLVINHINHVGIKLTYVVSHNHMAFNHDSEYMHLEITEFYLRLKYSTEYRVKKIVN